MALRILDLSGTFGQENKTEQKTHSASIVQARKKRNRFILFCFDLGRSLSNGGGPFLSNGGSTRACKAL